MGDDLETSLVRIVSRLDGIENELGNWRNKKKEDRLRVPRARTPSTTLEYSQQYNLATRTTSTVVKRKRIQILLMNFVCLDTVLNDLSTSEPLNESSGWWLVLPSFSCNRIMCSFYFFTDTDQINITQSDEEEGPADVRWMLVHPSMFPVPHFRGRAVNSPSANKNIRKVSALVSSYTEARVHTTNNFSTTEIHCGQKREKNNKTNNFG